MEIDKGKEQAGWIMCTSSIINLEEFSLMNLGAFSFLSFFFADF